VKLPLAPWLDLITSNCDDIASGVVHQRLIELASFHRELQRGMEAVIEQHRSQLPG